MFSNLESDEDDMSDDELESKERALKNRERDFITRKTQMKQILADFCEYSAETIENIHVNGNKRPFPVEVKNEPVTDEQTITISSDEESEETNAPEPFQIPKTNRRITFKKGANKNREPPKKMPKTRAAHMDTMDTTSDEDNEEELRQLL